MAQPFVFDWSIFQGPGDGKSSVAGASGAYDILDHDTDRVQSIHGGWGQFGGTGSRSVRDRWKSTGKPCDCHGNRNTY